MTAEAFLGVERSLLGRRWRARGGEDRAGLAIAQRLALPEIVGRLLAGRGIAPEAGEIILPRLRAAVPGNALDLATATATLALWGEIPDPEPLLAAQRSDGSWPNVGLYHMGRRRLEPQPRTPWFGSEALTTMFAVEALSRCRERLRSA